MKSSGIDTIGAPNPHMTRNTYLIPPLLLLIGWALAPTGVAQRVRTPPASSADEDLLTGIVLRPLSPLESAVGDILAVVKRRDSVSPANSYISGRVTDFGGLGIRGARITIFDVGTNQAKTVITGTFGRYQVSDLELGHGYVLSIQHSRYQFVTGSIFFEASGDPIGIDFQAEEIP